MTAHPDLTCLSCPPHTLLLLAYIQILSWYPRIVVFPQFIDAARAASIMQLARDQLQPSTVRVKGDPGERNEQAEGRSSSGVFLSQ